VLSSWLRDLLARLTSDTKRQELQTFRTWIGNMRLFSASEVTLSRFDKTKTLNLHLIMIRLLLELR